MQHFDPDPQAFLERDRRVELNASENVSAKKRLLKSISARMIHLGPAHAQSLCQSVAL